MKRLFTERRDGSKPRVAEALDDRTRTGLLSLVANFTDKDWFGRSFPKQCEDGNLNAGTDRMRLRDAMEAFHVMVPDDAEYHNNPDDGSVFDLLEFAYEYIAEANIVEAHPFWRHSHYTYDRKKGQEKFEEEVNRIFERNGMAFELRVGEVIRLASPVLHESLDESVFNTGDVRLDEMLESSREKFMNRSLRTRREAVEKLWDAWERLKTLELPGNKRESTRRILDRATAEPVFRKVLDDEARKLTDIGNRFMIRHTEIGKPPVSQSAHVDYLFHRMFAMIRLLLYATGRGG